MLLIFPPVAKPSEPPAGIAKLAGALRAHGHPCRILDGNMEGLLWLLGQEIPAKDTWTKRAVNARSRHITALRCDDTYASPDRYARAVSDLNRLLALSARERGAVVGLADYQHATLSPVRSTDLLHAAEHPEENPFHSWFSRRLPEVVEERNAGIVGFSLNYLSQALTTFAMIGFLRKTAPRLRIVLGGGLVTSWLARPDWRNPFGGLVDEMIAGPGEGPLLALLDGKSAEPLPAPPEYDALHLDGYLSPGLILPYSAAAGCYWNRCSFCPERAEGNMYRPVGTSRGMEELRLLVEKWRPSLIHLLDSAVSPALLQALSEHPPGAPWYGFARVDELLADEDFCHALRKSGCRMLKLGLESGDQGVLDGLNKGIEVGMASRVLSNLRKAGIAAYVYLLFGTPAETEREARRTLDFVVRHRDEIRFLNLAIFNMPVYGEDAARFGSGTFYEGDLSLYTPFRHPQSWERGQVRRFLEKDFKRHPAVAGILRNDPPVFTSNHAAFFTPPETGGEHLAPPP